LFELLGNAIISKIVFIHEWGCMDKKKLLKNTMDGTIGTVPVKL